jgi:hypothetical protein
MNTFQFGFIMIIFRNRALFKPILPWMRGSAMDDSAAVRTSLCGYFACSAGSAAVEMFK